ncbi:hypothetical protein ATN89_17290 [Comamonas thiooxydans]|uniref:hypothetical protein n=1 Tax=Comamonas thiooxydans TaxID=363952 RepID=UPI0007C536AB|nr:hypothetical protein [Comamonas thiooxydans]OAD82838.1 hypothetical protein ATN89_17290 [Comamonas thiooxydans]
MTGKLWPATPADIQKLHTEGLPMPPWEVIEVPHQIGAAQKIKEILPPLPLREPRHYFYMGPEGEVVLLIGLRESDGSYTCRAIPVINPELANLIE